MSAPDRASNQPPATQPGRRRQPHRRSRHRCVLIGFGLAAARVARSARAEAETNLNRMADQQVALVRTWLSQKHALAQDRTFFQAALAEGWPAVWVAGDMTWIAGPETSAQTLLDYERGFDQLLAELRGPFVCICEFNARQLAGEVVRQLLEMHTHILITEGIKESPWYRR